MTSGEGGRTAGDYKGSPEPLISFEGTRTRKGLKIKAKIDRGIYELGKKILEEELKKINLEEHKTNSQWNYTIS